MSVLENYEPKKVLHYFEEICKIPHGSGNTREISDYLVTFAKKHDLKYIQDETNNVIIFKPGTPGYEDAPVVIVQGHMDMVCEKRADITFDFEKEGLKLGVDGDDIHANGTTLGGDDGIAVAYGLALLDSTDIPHPPLEVVITVDEEIGLLGANDIDCSPLKGKIMLNLDSEAEGALWVSCAGGVRGGSTIPVYRVEGEGCKLELKLTGLLGGHSGSEIDKIRGNADKLMGRLLSTLSREYDFAISSMEGGTKDNVIPKECICTILVAKEQTGVIMADLKDMESELQKEYAGTDAGLRLEITNLGICTEEVLHPSSQEKVLFYLEMLPCGIQKMSGSIPGLVETSTNLGILKLEKDYFYAGSGIRSSIQSARDAVSRKIEHLTEFLGGEYSPHGAYPAWEYKKDSALQKLMVETWSELFDSTLEVAAIHAGLECGLFYEKIQNLDCVSLGPNMKDIHTSEERLSISSVERIWKYLLAVLKKMN